MVAPRNGPAGISASAMWRIRVASGQAAAKASRTRDAMSITRAPSLRRRTRIELNSAVASERGGGIVVSNRKYWPVGGRIQDAPNLVGERVAAAGTIRGELDLVQLIRFFAWPRAQ